MQQPSLTPRLALITQSGQETEEIGRLIGQAMQPQDIICLSGELGTGKTTLVRGIAHGWGSSDQVTSPTFVIVNEYKRPDGMRLYHLDCYRLASRADAMTLGLDDILSSSISATVIEWAEQVRAMLSGEMLWITLEHLEGEKRLLRFTGEGVRPLAIVSTLSDAFRVE